MLARDTWGAMPAYRQRIPSLPVSTIRRTDAGLFGPKLTEAIGVYRMHCKELVGGHEHLRPCEVLLVTQHLPAMHLLHIYWFDQLSCGLDSVCVRCDGSTLADAQRLCYTACWVSHACKIDWRHAPRLSSHSECQHLCKHSRHHVGPPAAGVPAIATCMHPYQGKHQTLYSPISPSLPCMQASTIVYVGAFTHLLRVLDSW